MIADTIGRILVIRVEFVLVGIVICKQGDRQVSKAFIKAGKLNYKTSGRAGRRGGGGIGAGCRV